MLKLVIILCWSGRAQNGGVGGGDELFWRCSLWHTEEAQHSPKSRWPNQPCQVHRVIIPIGCRRTGFWGGITRLRGLRRGHFCRVRLYAPPSSSWLLLLGLASRWRLVQYLLSQSQKTEHIPVWCWASVCDAGPTLNRHSVNVWICLPFSSSEACLPSWFASHHKYLIPANTRRWPNVVLMLGRTNIKATLVQCHVLAGDRQDGSETTAHAARCLSQFVWCRGWNVRLCEGSNSCLIQIFFSYCYSQTH